MAKNYFTCSLFLFFFLIFIASVVEALSSSDPNTTLITTATCEIFSTENFGAKSHGVIVLRQYFQSGATREEGDKIFVVINGTLENVTPPGYHGFHVHEKAPSESWGCSMLGPHLNPFNQLHGAINKYPKRHLGDLGNVLADEFGKVDVNIIDSFIQVGQVSNGIQCL